MFFSPPLTNVLSSFFLFFRSSRFLLQPFSRPLTQQSFCVLGFLTPLEIMSGWVLCRGSPFPQFIARVPLFFDFFLLLVVYFFLPLVCAGGSSFLCYSVAQTKALALIFYRPSFPFLPFLFPRAMIAPRLRLGRKFARQYCLSRAAFTYAFLSYPFVTLRAWAVRSPFLSG